MFENFPYTDFHQLNLDWIIKIAKDFLDQYTNIQQTIENGIESLNTTTNNGIETLNEKATELEGLLQQWYNTHSEDIANQLASALNDLNAWYTQHEGYLDTYVADSIQAVIAKGIETVNSIPDDYTELSNKVVNLIRAANTVNNTNNTVTVSEGNIIGKMFTTTNSATVLGEDIELANNNNGSCLKMFADSNIESINFSYAGIYDTTNPFILFGDENEKVAFITGGVINYHGTYTVTIPKGVTYIYLNFYNPANTPHFNIVYKNNIVNQNLFDKNDVNVVNNGYYNTSGVFVLSDDINQTGYIPVKIGKAYTCPYPGTDVNLYDSSKTLVGYISAAFTKNSGIAPLFYYSHSDPSNVAYMRFCYPGGNIDNVEISECGIVNLFNKYDPDVLHNKYINASGVLVDSDTLNESGFIAVSQYDVINSFDCRVSIALYDSNKTFVGAYATNNNRANGYYVVPANISYIRMAYLITDEERYYITKLTRGSANIVKTLNNNVLIPDLSVKLTGKNGVAFGTSQTYRSQTTGGYLSVLENLSGIPFDNQGIGNAQILHMDGYPDILQRIKSYAGYAGKDTVILEGFVNDWYRNGTLGTWSDDTETTVCGCVRSAINFIRTNAPYATLFMILDHYGQNNAGVNCASTAKNAGNKTQYEYYEEIAKVAESLGVIVIKEYALSEMSESTPNYFIDNMHVTEKGAIQSAHTIWSVMSRYYANVK